MSDSIDEQDVTRRAFAAYFRSGGIDQPAKSSGVVEHNGKAYVVLENVNGILAVYRVRNDGMLKRLRRWPSDLIYLSPAIRSGVPGRSRSPADWWEPRPWQTSSDEPLAPHVKPL
jgi:hypothetical protein